MLIIPISNEKDVLNTSASRRGYLRRKVSMEDLHRSNKRKQEQITQYSV